MSKKSFKMPKQYTCEAKGCRWIGPTKREYLRHKSRYHKLPVQSTPQRTEEEIVDTVMQEEVDNASINTRKYTHNILY